MHRTYIAFGSNQRDPLAQLLRARKTLALHPDLHEIAASHLYRTPPFGIESQPDFLNAVCAYDTTLSPRCLLAAINAVEAAHDRVRAEKNGPRTLDLDILLYDDRVIREARVMIPHPGLAERAFVLVPLADIAADVAVPGHDRVSALLARVDAHGVIREESTQWEHLTTKRLA
ncbi:MAG: 2-amino-4-hydroxy-6-hydroxymethyldihydropteridine diphosphokinase [Cardiobacteriaceae bacterium]|nr:2-amino-4-hydroxy-6-hydroxymethyldihydropteridine diphosphokinase [Cardiobacteriaceae bacterium]